MIENNNDSNKNNNNKQTKVQISVCASKLKNLLNPLYGTSDPYAVVTILAGSSNEKPGVLGRTEVIENCLDPSWVTTFETTYTFGRETRFHVGIFDYESSESGRLNSMGSATFELGEVLCSKGGIKAKKLKKGGTVFVRVKKAVEVDCGTLQLVLQGIKLRNMDGFFGKSDPFYIVYSQDKDNTGGRVWQAVYRSEIIMDNLNPRWHEASIPLGKLCGGNKDQCIQIEVWDWEKSGKHKRMGKFQTSVNGLIVSSVLPVCTEGNKPSTENAFHLVDDKKSYGYVRAIRATVVRKNAHHPDSETVGNLVLPGRTSSLETSSDTPPKKFISINGEKQINPVWKAWKKNKDSESNFPPSSNPQALPPPMPVTKPNFVDYISGGTEINLTVAIDFTGSNGNPRQPGTLHYIHRDGQLNDYEKALTAVGSIVAKYDSDQMFPVLGFGAKYDGVIRHCFQVGPAPELLGVRGMLEGYRSVFKTGMTMSGPTVFAEVIQSAAAQARNKQEALGNIGRQSYSILLILTDGAVTDVEQTKEAIRQASTAPLSIVIVGIGHADFSAMRFLDDFQQREGSWTRDIVHFVEFSKHRHNKEELIKETLGEIPDQLVGYFYENGIMPLPLTSGSSLNIFEEDHNEEEDIDLPINIDADGNISLNHNTPGASWDRQSYGSAYRFLPPPVAPPAGYSGSGNLPSYPLSSSNHPLAESDTSVSYGSLPPPIPPPLSADGIRRKIGSPYIERGSPCYHPAAAPAQNDSTRRPSPQNLYQWAIQDAC